MILRDKEIWMKLEVTLYKSEALNPPQALPCQFYVTLTVSTDMSSLPLGLSLAKRDQWTVALEVR